MERGSGIGFIALIANVLLIQLAHKYQLLIYSANILTYIVSLFVFTLGIIFLAFQQIKKNENINLIILLIIN